MGNISDNAMLKVTFNSPVDCQVYKSVKHYERKANYNAEILARSMVNRLQSSTRVKDWTEIYINQNIKGSFEPMYVVKRNGQWYDLRNKETQGRIKLVIYDRSKKRYEFISHKKFDTHDDATIMQILINENQSLIKNTGGRPQFYNTNTDSRINMG